MSCYCEDVMWYIDLLPWSHNCWWYLSSILSWCGRCVLNVVSFWACNYMGLLFVLLYIVWLCCCTLCCCIWLLSRVKIVCIVIQKCIVVLFLFNHFLSWFNNPIFTINIWPRWNCCNAFHLPRIGWMALNNCPMTLIWRQGVWMWFQLCCTNNV